MSVTWTNKANGFDAQMKAAGPGDSLHIVTYAKGKFRCVYLNCSQADAQAKFEKMMKNRNEYEKLYEGWDAAIESIRFTDGEAWVGDMAEEMQWITQKMLSDVLART